MLKFVDQKAVDIEKDRDEDAVLRDFDFATEIFRR